jgi:molybdenum cofactor cytidylyltransferase
MGEIWSIILAAGESKRMGFPKMLLEFNGRTMIENVIEHVAGSDTDGILVVLGSGHEELIKLVGKYDVNTCYNENYREGMLSSVQCGFINLPLDIDGIVVFQGDQPYITPAVINSVIKEFRSTGRGIVIPVFRGKRGHPLLLDSKYRSEINSLNPAEGLRSIVYLNGRDVIEVETDEPGILRDFDTYDDYKKRDQ